MLAVSVEGIGKTGAQRARAPRRTALIERTLPLHRIGPDQQVAGSATRWRRVKAAHGVLLAD